MLPARGMKHLRLLLIALVGCATDSGGLGQADVSTECSPTDFACVTRGLDGPVAVGGVVPLALDVNIAGTATPTVSLFSGNTDVLKAAGTEVVGQSPGIAALVLLDSEGRAVDFLHVSVATPTRLGFHRRDTGLDLGELVDDVELLVGDSILVEVEPYVDSQRLLGHGSSDWTAGSAITLLKDGAPARRRIVARTPGEATLSVNAFGFDKTLTIRVLP